MFRSNTLPLVALALVAASSSLACSGSPADAPAGEAGDASVPRDAASPIARDSGATSEPDAGTPARDASAPDAATSAADAASDASAPRDAGADTSDASDRRDAATSELDGSSDAAGASDGASASTDAGPGPTFAFATVSTALKGPAFAQLVDWDGDGALDILVSSFGKSPLPVTIPNGSVTVLRHVLADDSWAPTTLVPESANIKFPNDLTVADVDGDGDTDLIVPYGFLACAANPLGGPCGGLAWFERQGATLTRHDVVANGAALFYHRALLHDVDGDGVKDLVTVGEEKTASLVGTSTQRAVPQWFKGVTAANRFETTPRNLAANGVSALGSLPELVDVDGDGDLDLASAEFFVSGGSFAWLENPGAAGANGGWTRRVIRADLGPSIQLAPVPNLLGAGTLGWVGANHTNTGKIPPDTIAEAVFTFTKPADPRSTWTATAISEGIKSRPGSPFAPQGAPGVFGWGDADGDGDVDLAVSGDGDERVFLLEHQAPGRFATRVLSAGLGQAGGMKIGPIGPGATAGVLVTSYEADKVLVFRKR